MLHLIVSIKDNENNNMNFHKENIRIQNNRAAVLKHLLRNGRPSYLLVDLYLVHVPNSRLCAMMHMPP